MQSPPKEWQAALQRAQAINPLRKSPHSKEDFDLDALLDAENRRRVELVRCIFLQFRGSLLTSRLTGALNS